VVVQFCEATQLVPLQSSMLLLLQRSKSVSAEVQVVETGVVHAAVVPVVVQTWLVEVQFCTVAQVAPLHCCTMVPLQRVLLDCAVVQVAGALLFFLSVESSPPQPTRPMDNPSTNNARNMKTSWHLQEPVNCEARGITQRAEISRQSRRCALVGHKHAIA